MFSNLYVYAYVFMHSITTHEKKEAMNLKSIRRDIWKGLEGGKGREKCYNNTTISQKKLVFKVALNLHK